MADNENIKFRKPKPTTILGIVRKVKERTGRIQIVRLQWLSGWSIFSKLHNTHLTTAHDQAFTNDIKTQLNTFIDTDLHVDNDHLRKLLH